MTNSWIEQKINFIFCSMRIFNLLYSRGNIFIERRSFEHSYVETPTSKISYIYELSVVFDNVVIQNVCKALNFVG